MRFQFKLRARKGCENRISSPATIFRRVVVFTLATLSVLTVPSIGGPIGRFEEHRDVGSPKNSGSATYNAASQEYSITASGVNMWAERDEFHFVWKRLKGDFILRARIELIGEGVDPHRKLGWMIRKSLEADSPYADAAVHGDGLTSLQYRRTKGAITEQVESSMTGPDVIQLERKGDSFTFSSARFGDPLEPCKLENLPLGDEVYVGLFLCSHNADVIEKAVFRNVRIIRPAKDNFVPYRDYIGSNLELLDVRTGLRQTIHSSAIPFEAPNWTPDGGTLIFNSSGRDPETRGRLYRFNLMTRQPTLINTDFANRLNNDHVLSFDGTMIGISDQSASHGGRSTIFTLPVSGGVPKRITPLAPSYLHGWSPDAKWLVYTGGRNNEYDIYKIASDGTGQEINLTQNQGLDDGPEYTPDGNHIYFNSTRSGTMQIWRMKPDGSAQEQISDDKYNNWFPHISPGGKQIAFISFPSEIDPEDHPYYKHVYLRLTPIASYSPKVIAYVYGGQGTINVPSWSPDGKMLAFVSNTDTD